MPEFKSVLSSNSWTHIVSIFQNDSLTERMKKFQIDDFLLSQPEEIKLKYPLPPFLERLPKERQIGFKKIFFNTAFSSYQQKRELLKYIQSFNQSEYLQIFRSYGYELLPAKYQIQIDKLINQFKILYNLRGNFEEYAAQDMVEIFEQLPEKLHQEIKAADKSVTYKNYPGFRYYPQPMMSF